MNSHVREESRCLQRLLERCWRLSGESRQLLRSASIALCMLMTLSTQIAMASPGDRRLADDTKVILELNGESLESALKKIEKLTPFRFVYRSEEVHQVENLKLEKAERTVEKTLVLLLENTSLTFRRIKRNILIVRKSSADAGASEKSEDQSDLQDRAVSGRVLSSDNNGGLPGVSVIIKGSQSGTVTDAEGNYTINVPSESSVLVFSFIGYKTMEVAVSQRSTIDVTLELDMTELEEVVVTSFGIAQRKQALGYSVPEVRGEDITKMRQPNIVSSLQGQVAGLQITNSGGAPGMSSRILIRGITSLDPTADNQPLFVIDGIPIDNNTFETAPGKDENTPRGLSNRAMDINPNDIESVSILKGAAATALYGVRAANGAIVMTTKKGKSGRVQINASSTLGFENVNKYPSFQEKYGQGFGGLYAPEDIYPAWGAPISVASKIDPDYRYHDNYRNAMQTGKLFDNHVSISGGNEMATFYASVSHTDHEGVIPFSTWGRMAAKISGTLKFSEKFSASASVNYTNSGGNRVPHDRLMENLMYFPATRDVRKFEDENGIQNYVGLSDNPLYQAKYATFVDDVDRTLGNVFLSYKPASWISFNYRIGSDFYSDFREEISPGPRNSADAHPINEDGGFLEHTRITSRIINSNFYTQINNDLSEKFSTTLRLGHELFQEERNSLVNTGTEFEIPQFFQFSNVKMIQTYQELMERRLVGVYGDLSLNYDDLVYLNVTGRNDWTSTLPKGNNSFFYPSVSLSFIFNDILNLPPVLSYGKLRGSFGQVGKDTRSYKTSTVYERGLGFPIDGVLGYSRAKLKGSDLLKPERTTTVEFGTDLKFFENRLGLEFTWYKANSRDQIFDVPVSEATGYELIAMNVGEIENRGMELFLTATPLVSDNFTWDVTLNFTRNRNKVIDIAEGLNEFPIGEQFGYSSSTVTMKLKEGDAYGNIYGRSYQRYYGATTPTDLKYLDHDLPLLIGPNGFPMVNTQQLILGNSQPQWLGGIRNTFSYKGLSLSFLIDARWGIDQYDQYHNFLSAFGKLDYSENRNDMVVFEGVVADGSPNATEVYLGQGIGADGVDYGAGFYRNYHRTVSENFVKDASFVKLRNASLSYSLPKPILSRTPFQAISLSATVNNVILWTPWINFDPESFSAGAGGNATGFSGLGYPAVTSTLFSLNLTL